MTMPAIPASVATLDQAGRDYLSVETARAAAAAYVWGLQDATPACERDTTYSLDFAAAFAERKALYLAGRCGMMPNLQSAYLTFVRTRGTKVWE